MAIISREIRTSRAGFSSDGTSLKAQKVFHVHDPVTDIVSSSIVYAMLGSGSPDPLPTWGALFDAIPALKLMNVGIERVDGDQPIWEATFDYGTDDSSDGLQPDDVGYQEFSSEIRAEFQDVWRSNASTGPTLVIPADGTVVSETADIGGTKIDVSGEPVSALRILQEATITKVVLGAPNWALFDSLIGKRNDATYFGAIKGRILFKGVRVSRVKINRYAVDHVFVRDNMFHLVQHPKRDFNGIPAKDALAQPHALQVYWKQPFPEFGNFSTLGLTLA